MLLFCWGFFFCLFVCFVLFVLFCFVLLCFCFFVCCFFLGGGVAEVFVCLFVVVLLFVFGEVFGGVIDLDGICCVVDTC